jgi:hypothetical protein
MKNEKKKPIEHLKRHSKRNINTNRENLWCVENTKK